MAAWTSLRRAQRLALALAACLSVAAAATPGDNHVHSANGPKAKLPNIIMMLTDDLDLRHGSMIALPNTMHLLKDQGANLSNYFINTPVCCPSRATLLSGRFEHNNRATSYTAVPACMHQNTSQTSNPEFWARSFIPALQDAGYVTGIFGKLLNVMDDYGCVSGGLPKGMSREYVMCNPAFYRETWADDGKAVKTGGKPKQYTTSLIGNASLSWISDVVESGKDHPPFFAYLGPHAPHLPATPAEWYKDHPIGNLKAPRDTPYYNYSALDHHHLLAAQPILNQADAAGIDEEYSKRLRSLVSVDDITFALHKYLTKVGEWDNTFFFFTSDHGYSLGQFRIPSHKTQVYDHNTRVPFLVHGPGITPGIEIPHVVQMVDVGPTFMELAGLQVPEYMDGRSFAGLLKGEKQASWKTTALVEYHSIHPYPSGRHPHDEANNTFSALRIINDDEDILYAEFTDVLDPSAWTFPSDRINFVELYNVSNDYYQLHNIAHTASPDWLQRLHTQLHELIKCKGQSQCP